MTFDDHIDAILATMPHVTGIKHRPMDGAFKIVRARRVYRVEAPSKTAAKRLLREAFRSNPTPRSVPVAGPGYIMFLCECARPVRFRREDQMPLCMCAACGWTLR